jgi:hypothetical protein
MCVAPRSEQFGHCGFKPKRYAWHTIAVEPESTMNIEAVATCIRVLDELSAGFTVMPAENSDASQAGLACVIAQSILVEYAAHRTDGYSHDEAMRLTAARQQAVKDASPSLQALLTRHKN